MIDLKKRAAEAIAAAPAASAVPATSSSGTKKPSKDLTGVDPALTDVCATISKQIYDATSKDSFNLSDVHHQAEVLYFHDHGLVKETVPPLVIAVSGDTLILGWRGSKTVMDWASDVAYAPVASSRWSPITPNVRAHSAYSALVESDLALHEKTIIEEITKRGISQIILTGHSLAGGMANVAHLFLEAQLSQPDTAWSSLREQVTCRTVAFAAPMTAINMDETRSDAATNDFLQRVADHSCNIIYGCDVVPHCVGDVGFLNKVIEDVIPELASGVTGDGYLMSWLVPKVQSKIQTTYDSFVDVRLKSSIPVLIAYHHVGNVIYYHDATSDPVLLRDSRFLPDSVPEFRAHKIALPRNNKNKKVSHIKQLTDAHGFFPTALSFNLDK
jgi:hypothetical protein